MQEILSIQRPVRACFRALSSFDPWDERRLVFKQYQSNKHSLRDRQRNILLREFQGLRIFAAADQVVSL